MEISFGEYLRKERETREISIDDVAKATKIQKRILIALEENRLDQIPSLTFVRGFIRLYAQHIGLEPNQAILRFEEYLKQIHPELYGEKPAAKQPVRVWNVVVPILIVLVIAAVVVLSVIGNRSQQAAPGPVKGPHLPTPHGPGGTQPAKPIEPGNPPAAQITNISPPFTVKIKAIEICWLLATIDEKTSREATLYPGDSIEIKADQRLSLLLGNAGGAHLTVNSASLQPVGGHWKPARILIPDDLPKYLPEGFKFKLEEKTETNEKPGEIQPAPIAPKPAVAPAPPNPAPASTAAPTPKPLPALKPLIQPANTAEKPQTPAKKVSPVQIVPETKKPKP